jgi:catecholate siderophore receptor
MKKQLTPSHTRDALGLKPISQAIFQAFGVLVSAQMLSFNAYAAEPVTQLPEVAVTDKALAKEPEAAGYNPKKSANQKFVAPLIDTPKSVTVITKDVIEDTGSLSMQDALRTAPGITFGAGEGGIAVGDRPYIRGFEAMGSIYVDGLRDIGPQVREVFAIEQMEVIKGPSGAYDGRGSAGGSININTKQAKKGDFVKGSIGLGTDSFKRATVDGNFMLGDNSALRLVAMGHDADIPGRDHVENKRFGFMPSLTLGLDGPTQLNASWYHMKTDDTPDWGNPYYQPGGFPIGKPVGSKDHWYGVKSRDFSESTTDIGTLKIQHAFNDNVTLRNTTRVAKTRNDYVATRPTISTDALMQNRQVTRDLRGRDARVDTIANLTDVTVNFDTGTLKHHVNAGVEFSREKLENYTYAGGALPTATTSLDNPDANTASTATSRNSFPAFEGKTTNRSAYVFDSIDLSENWIVNGGLRIDSYRTEFENRNVTTGAQVSEFENDKTFKNYQLGAVYKLQSNANIYATYATSSSPVGLNLGQFDYAGGQLTAGTQNLSPERSKTVELGTKWIVLNDLSLNAAIFKTVKDNARVPISPTSFDNSGEVEVKGFEFSVAGNITEQWKVFGGYTYLDAEQTKAGTVGDLNAAGGPLSKGKQMYGVAKNSASLWTTYQVHPDFTIGGGAFYVDKVYADPANNGYIPAYVRWDAMAKYKINSHFDLQLNVQNLTDERYYSATYFRHNAIPAPGRLSFLTLNIKY